MSPPSGRGLTTGRAVALGLLHGPLELLPISSSAHVALLAGALSPRDRKTLEVGLHVGTGLGLAGAVRGAPGLAWLALTLAPPGLAGALGVRAIERHLAGPGAAAAGPGSDR